MNKKVKIIIFAGVGLVAVVIALKVFGGSTAPAPTGSLSTSSKVVVPGNVGTTTVSPSQSSEFSGLLSSVKSIDIDTSIFENPAYKSLRDYPVTLGSDIIGRQNPFAPIGTDPLGGTSTDTPIATNTDLQTLQPNKVTSSSAEFGAQMTTADSAPVNIIFEYGTSDTFGNATAPVVLNKNGTVLMPVSDLTPATLYYVRAVSAQGAITTTGTTMSFTTLDKPVTPPKKKR